MKRLYAVLFCLIFMFIGLMTDVYAFDWKNLNVELLDQSENDSQIVLTLKDKQERIFKVIYQDESMLAKFAAKIIKYKNEFYAWRSIRFSDISIMVFANYLNVVVIPQSLPYNDINLAAAIPAGIIMTCNPESDIMYYDFRIMKEDQFIRVTGDYSTEDELVNKIKLAYDNPEAFLRHANQSVPLSQENTGSLNEKTVQALIYMNYQDWNGRHKIIPIETIQQVVELKQANPGVTKAELWKMVKKAKIQITKRQMELILIFYFNEYM